MGKGKDALMKQEWVAYVYSQSRGLRIMYYDFKRLQGMESSDTAGEPELEDEAPDSATLLIDDDATATE
eukprot:7482750-Alexandrium_andersonii.AAC.1